MLSALGRGQHFGYFCTRTYGLRGIFSGFQQSLFLEASERAQIAWCMNTTEPCHTELWCVPGRPATDVLTIRSLPGYYRVLVVSWASHGQGLHVIMRYHQGRRLEN